MENQNNGILMKCGHIAIAVDENGKPVCPICVGITPDAKIIANKNEISLKGRKAKCWECGYECPSSFNLPMFEYKPNAKEDEFYCGCHGWD